MRALETFKNFFLRQGRIEKGALNRKLAGKDSLGSAVVKVGEIHISGSCRVSRCVTRAEPREER